MKRTLEEILNRDEGGTVEVIAHTDGTFEEVVATMRKVECPNCHEEFGTPFTPYRCPECGHIWRES